VVLSVPSGIVLSDRSLQGEMFAGDAEGGLLGMAPCSFLNKALYNFELFAELTIVIFSSNQLVRTAGRLGFCLWRKKYA